MKTILGLAGEIASGKGTVASYILKRHGGSSYRLSDILRGVLGRMHLPENRDNMQKMSEALRQYFGEDILSKIILEDLKRSESELIILDGVRRYSDIKHLKKENKFKLIYIEADLEKRFSRIASRKDNADDKGKTLKRFRKEHRAEAEIRIKDLKRKADFVIDNNGNLKALYRSVEKVMERVLK